MRVYNNYFSSKLNLQPSCTVSGNILHTSQTGYIEDTPIQLITLSIFHLLGGTGRTIPVQCHNVLYTRQALLQASQPINWTAVVDSSWQHLQKLEGDTLPHHTYKYHSTYEPTSNLCQLVTFQRKVFMMPTYVKDILANLLLEITKNKFHLHQTKGKHLLPNLLRFTKLLASCTPGPCKDMTVHACETSTLPSIKVVPA